ncbi:MAG: NTP transferase domain-containing protein, partial [Candidatus Thermoplasmatota archaeon]|nr:NTP transferase domain-containing protein [Candidatus Thermoplasmatota archaeon]
METIPAAVVLAAGRSRRLGRPKALVGVNGRPLVAWIHQRLLAAGCEVMVVVNPDLADDVRAVLPGALIAVNDNPDAGRTRSLPLGLPARREHHGRSPPRLVLAP